MAKVVGKEPQYVKQCTCKNCASIIEYLQKEVKYHHYTDLTGCSESTPYIKCPECNADVTVKNSYDN